MRLELKRQDDPNKILPNLPHRKTLESVITVANPDTSSVIAELQEQRQPSTTPEKLPWLNEWKKAKL
jgi:hypothetical protein